MFKLKKRWIISSLVLTVILAMVISPVWAEKGPQKSPRFEPMEELTTIKISTDMWLPTKPASIDEMIERGDTRRIMVAYAEGVLRKVYNIAIDRIAIRIYGVDPSVMLAALAAGTAPSIMRTNETFGGSVAAAVSKGLAADITPYIGYILENIEDLYPDAGFRAKWDAAWIDGKCYGLLPGASTPEPLTILFRKDWFKEAGVFGSDGIAGPPDNWTTDDFAAVSRKITDPKKDRFGFLLVAGDTGAGKEFQGWMEQFGGQMVIPDKTGENTFKAGFDLPSTVNFFTFLQGMVKDKSLLSGVEYESWIMEGFFEGRAAMFTSWPSQAGWRAVDKNATYAPQAFEDVVGIAPLPIGPQGINAGRVIGGCDIVNPLQTDEQIEATVKFYIFNNILGEQTEMRDMAGYWEGTKEMPIGMMSQAYYMADAWSLFPESYLVNWKKALELPLLPNIESFGMYIASPKGLEKTLLSAVQTILLDPDADVVTELAKATDIANKSVLKFKVDGATTENFKKYYAALGSWYQENAPEYYKEAFLNDLEEYYKVW